MRFTPLSGRLFRYHQRHQISSEASTSIYTLHVSFLSPTTLSFCIAYVLELFQFCIRFNEMNTTSLRGLRTASIQSSIYFDSKTALKLHSLRLASTSTSSSSKPYRSRAPTSSNTTTPTQQVTSTAPRSSLNGPLSTLPAALELPVRAPNEPFFFKYAFKLGKAYATFYKTGVKNIWTNYNLSRPLQDLIDKKYNFSLSSAVAAKALSRSEFQLLHRNRHDTKRVPLFGLVFIICGEFTPLVVIALSSVVPWTCRIPKQIDSDRSKLEKRRAISFRNLTDTPPAAAGIVQLSRQQLIHISWSLGLSSSIWDYLGGQYPGLPAFLLRRKVTKAVEYIQMDDSLISASGLNLKTMDMEEVRMALVERGVDVIGKSDKWLLSHLEAWMKSREKGEAVERLLLTR
jgi:hypothetical protein